MKNKKQYRVVQRAFMSVVLCLLIAVPAVFADYIKVEYTTEPTVLARSNNNGYAVGWVGDFGPAELGAMLFTDVFLVRELPNVRGIICTDVNSPEYNTVYYEPEQARCQGQIFVIDDVTECPFNPSAQVTGHVFIPMDINDDNVIVGNFFVSYLDISSGQPKVLSLPFIAEGPQGIPTIILGVNGSSEIVPMPVDFYGQIHTYAMGINNSGDIVGGIAGLVVAGTFVNVFQGFTVNKTDVDDDGLIDVTELRTFNCGGNVITIPMSINNNGMVAGLTLSMRYSLEDGSYIVDGNGNYLLSDDALRIPAGISNMSDFGTNVLQIKYLAMSGFVKSVTAANDDFITINYASTQDMENDQTPGETEIYGTVPYAILDSGRVLLGYTAIDPNDGQEDEWFTANSFFAGSPNPEDQPDFSKLMPIYRSSPPLYDRASLALQGNNFPGAATTVIGDINSSGVAVGAYMDDSLPAAGPYSFVYIPGLCVEDNSGFIDIMGRPFCTTSEAAPLYVPVRVQACPNAVDALGFEVLYDTNVLEYVDFVTDPVDNDLPATLLNGWQTEGQASWEADEVGYGLVRIGAYTSDYPILENEEGILGYLVFNSFSAEVTGLEIQNLVDDIAAWTASGACLSQATGDCNDDGEVTPADALCAFEKGLGVCDTSCGPCVEVPADVDGDNDTDMYDVLCIFKYYLGLSSCLD